jgi:hypothetical protein
VVFAVDLRVPTILSDDLVEPVLQGFLGSERQVELKAKEITVSFCSSPTSNRNWACLCAKVRAILILPLPVRPVVQDTAAALFARLFEGVFGDVPVVAEEVVGVHLVVDLVGAGRRGALDFGGLVGRFFARGRFGGDESCLFCRLRLGDAEAAENVVEGGRLVPGGIDGRCCEGTRREEDKQEFGDEEHLCCCCDSEDEVEDGG